MKSFFELHIWPLRGKLFRMVYLWTKDRDLSEDMLQNVFEKTVERQKELQTHPNLNGWIVKSLKNEVLMHFRKNGKIDGLERADHIPQPETNALELSESNRIIFSLVENLPEKQREVFQLREIEEMSYEEISNFLEISLEQVKVNLHRARKTIREKLINQGITP
ncbi:RNA polymerase sigma-70 factor (ECF subfamily) [Algoriphagus boseongensis]|uniref:RNA polymerase sigma-70 factor (ECF subfamily) n=1 Tax=Algoriphagus boseongensis TaxID=1442587 RepID=A0A4R6T5U7_9BACT|nr:RNA polymerase sigma factor [Algoriphagus boseongensis]TDQ17389.1 RNA polymerase sigma-70 factor (ECF subfamily) [Algoriphagus boseongensis]